MLTPTRRTGWTAAPAASKACPLVKGGRPIKQHRGQRASLLQSYSNAHAHNPGQASAAAPAWSAAKKKPRHWQQRVDPDVLTRQLLAWSVVPAVLLAAQPLLAVGQASLAWQASLRDMFSFTVLLGVFISCEPAAAAASAVSAAGAALSLAVWPAGQLPAMAAATALLLAAAYAATLCTALLPQHLWAPWTAAACETGNQQSQSQAASQPGQQGTAASYHQHSDDRESRLQAIQQGLGVVGGGLLLQFCWETLTRQPAAAGPWAAAVAVGAAAVIAGSQWLDARGKGEPHLQEFKQDWPAWSATLLLVSSALDQLVQLALHPGPAPDASEVVLLLLMVLANGLMVPRALHTRQFMWFTGTCSGTLLAAGQLVVLGLQSVSTGLPGRHAVSGMLAWLQQVGCIPWFSSVLGVVGSWLGGVPGVAVGVLLVWLWLAASVLHTGWRWILSEAQA